MGRSQQLIELFNFVSFPHDSVGIASNQTSLIELGNPFYSESHNFKVLVLMKITDYHTLHPLQKPTTTINLLVPSKGQPTSKKNYRSWICLVCAQDCPAKSLARQNFSCGFACPWVANIGQKMNQSWQKALTCEKVGNHPMKDQFFGHTKTSLTYTLIIIQTCPIISSLKTIISLGQYIVHQFMLILKCSSRPKLVQSQYWLILVRLIHKKNSQQIIVIFYYKWA